MNNSITSYSQLADDENDNDNESYDELQLFDSDYDDEYDDDDGCHSILSTVWEESRSDYDSNSISNNDNDDLSEKRYETTIQDRKITFQDDDRWGDAIPCSPSDQKLISPARRRSSYGSGDDEDSLEGKVFMSVDLKQGKKDLEYSNTTCTTEQSSISTFESSLPVVSLVDYQVCEDIPIRHNESFNKGMIQSQTIGASKFDDDTVYNDPRRIH